jgi:hypothetical protein
MCHVHARSRRKRPVRDGGQSWPFIQIGPVHIAGNISRVLASVPGPWFGPSNGRGATDHELIPGRSIDSPAGPALMPRARCISHRMSSGAMRKVTVNRRKWRIAGKRE